METESTAPSYPPQQPNPQQQPPYPQQQPPYPQQQPPYPQQQPYPVGQGYTSTAYPPDYPGQPGAHYPSEPQKYGKGEPVLTSEAPPPYYPTQQAQQQSANTVVVASQPTTTVHTVYRSGNSEYGLPAIIFAVAITICFLSLGCWHAILCSAIGIALGIGATSSASTGNMDVAKQYNAGSLTCTVFSLVSVVVPFIILIIYIIAIAA